MDRFPLATGWNGLPGRVRAGFELDLEYRKALRRGGIDPLFDETEALLLMPTDQSTHNVEVEAIIIEKLKTRFGEPQTVEAVAIVAAYKMVSHFLVAMEI